MSEPMTAEQIRMSPRSVAEFATKDAALKKCGELQRAIDLVSRVNLYLDKLPSLLLHCPDKVAAGGVPSEYLKEAQRQADDALRELYQIDFDLARK